MGTFLGKTGDLSRRSDRPDRPGRPGRPDEPDVPGRPDIPDVPDGPDDPDRPPALVCIGGTCQEPVPGVAYTDPVRAACRGKRRGDACQDVEPVPTGECPNGDWYAHMAGDPPCPEGYVFIGRRGTGWHGWVEGADGRCECSAWCERKGYGADCRGPGPGPGPDEEGLGAYEYPEWLKEWMSKLAGRGSWLLDPSNYGFSKDWMDYAFGSGFDKIRSAGRGTREGLQDVLGRQGMLDTGTETKLLGQTAWNTEQVVADLMRDVFLEEERQRKADIRDYTGLSNQLFAGGLGFEQLLEAINAGRRGEGQAALMMLLQLLNTLKW